MAYMISVSYGHGEGESLSASGKLYDYPTEKKYRVGDIVVVPVTQSKTYKRNGKVYTRANPATYNTLSVVRMSNKDSSPAGFRKMDHLTDPKNDIKPKDVSYRLEVAKKMGLNVENDRQVNITTLPGYKVRQSNEKWSRAPKKEDSTARIISRGE